MFFSQMLIASLTLAFRFAECRVVRDVDTTVPTITLSSGVVIGTTTQYPGATATNNKFLGIPYALSPPVRFGLPQVAPSWNIPLSATEHKSACLQQGLATTAIQNSQSEDCLYVNVYSPAGTTPDSNKTVMVWVYGGDLQSGDAGMDFYDGSSFAANQDVIIVTFGYRLNVFGFSNSPEIAVSQQNVGFYDQRFVLDWVQSNIRAFGGDPSKVTIFGQSAGGYSVKYLIGLPQSHPPPYIAGIMESQATVLPGNGAQNWNSLVTALGCDSAPSPIACARAADAFEIQAIINNGSLNFPPEVDGITFVTDPNPNFVNGQAAQVPILLGTNGQEASIISELLGLNGTPLIDLAEVLADLLPGIGDKIVGVLNETLPLNPLSTLTTRVFTDLIFTCPTSKLASILQNSNYPTWRYYYNASFPNTDLGNPNLGAYHGAEFPEVFGTYPRANATTQEVGLSMYMQTAWATFAKQPSSGPAPGWPEYGSSHNVANLGSNGSSGEQTISASQIDGLCPILDLLGDLTGLLATANASAPAASALNKILNLEK